MYQHSVALPWGFLAKSVLGEQGADVIASRVNRYSSWISVWCYCFIAGRIEGLNKSDLGESIFARRAGLWKNIRFARLSRIQACIVFAKHISRLSFPFKVWIAKNREVWVLKKDLIILVIQTIVGKSNSEQNRVKTKFYASSGLVVGFMVDKLTCSKIGRWLVWIQKTWPQVINTRSVHVNVTLIWKSLPLDKSGHEYTILARSLPLAGCVVDFPWAASKPPWPLVQCHFCFLCSIAFLFYKNSFNSTPKYVG